MYVDHGAQAVPFAHASEAELARILDYYGIAWEYEPRVFPIRWNLDGAVVESFAPDFYLPDLDLYVELTTLRQSLVRKKNRKLRRLRELYPDVQIKLFYARDFRALMLKYGRIGLLDSLAGAGGQATPPRRVSPETDAAARGRGPEGPDERLVADARRPGSATDVAPLADVAPPRAGGERRRRSSQRPRPTQSAHV